MKKTILRAIAALITVFLVLFALSGCGEETRLVEKVVLEEPYLITFSGISYEDDPESCTYVRYGIDGQGNILLETRSFDTEGTLQRTGHLYLKSEGGLYTYYIDEGKGYNTAQSEGVSSATVNAAHFQDLYLFQMRLNDATTLYDGDAEISGGNEIVFLGRTCLSYSVETTERDQSTSERYTARYDYTVDRETGVCMRVVYLLLDENGREIGGKSGFVCTEFDLSPENFVTLKS